MKLPTGNELRRKCEEIGISLIPLSGEALSDHATISDWALQRRHLTFMREWRDSKLWIVALVSAVASAASALAAWIAVWHSSAT